MDMCMIDLGKANVKTGDTVSLFGWENSVQQMAEVRQTITYEIISTISARVHRVYIEE